MVSPSLSEEDCKAAVGCRFPNETPGWQPDRAPLALALECLAGRRSSTSKLRMLYV
jgi:hypothetical protein